MIEVYCPNCGKVTGHKRAMGMGTFLGACVTFGTSLAATPFYPKRCIVCGCKTEGVWDVDPQTGKYRKLTDEELKARIREEAEAHRAKIKEGAGIILNSAQKVVLEKNIEAKMEALIKKAIPTYKENKPISKGITNLMDKIKGKEDLKK